MSAFYLISNTRLTQPVVNLINRFLGGSCDFPLLALVKIIFGPHNINAQRDQFEKVKPIICGTSAHEIQDASARKIVTAYAIDSIFPEKNSFDLNPNIVFMIRRNHAITSDTDAAYPFEGDLPQLNS